MQRKNPLPIRKTGSHPLRRSARLLSA
jgi:hypothetical protein